MKYITAFLLLSQLSFAAPVTGSWTCAGKTILLLSHVTKVDDPNFNQVLYTLKIKDSDKNSVTNIGYFLGAKKTISTCTRNFKSANDVGGAFDLTIKSCEDEDDGEGIPQRNVASGVLKYSHGPLVGKEDVTCVFE